MKSTNELNINKKTLSIQSFGILNLKTEMIIMNLLLKNNKKLLNNMNFV